MSVGELVFIFLSVSVHECIHAYMCALDMCMHESVFIHVHACMNEGIFLGDGERQRAYFANFKSLCLSF